MKKLFFTGLIALFIAGCALTAPYSITFTTPNESVINPDTSTLDFVLNDSALAYISSFRCSGNNRVELLPVITDDMQSQNVHNLALNVLSEQADGLLCNITVTAFDKTTTASENSTIDVYIRMKPEKEDGTVEAEPDYSVQETACTNAGGTWNECSSPCEEGDELCIQVCVPKCEFTNDSELELSEENSEEPIEEPSEEEQES